jgi:hypothetical protein
MWTRSGKKLLFKGGEFGQCVNGVTIRLDWHLLNEALVMSESEIRVQNRITDYWLPVMAPPARGIPALNSVLPRATTINARVTVVKIESETFQTSSNELQTQVEVGII